MTSLVELSPLVGAINFSSLSTSYYNKNKRHRHILKSKQNTLKLKCNRALKRKLKKYKLRQDGQEDQDILDISDILVTSLIIKSPNNSQESVTDLNDIELWRPKNYLFKMLSKKQVSSTIIENKNCKMIENEHIDSYSNSQERKQMNAFQLLMESRNKIIGSNSPGKEKTVDDTLVQEIMENKNIKAKRILVLQKMAEAKGSLKTKEIEEFKEKYVKKKLEKRADKFKSMLSNQNSRYLNQDKINEKSNGRNEKCTANQYCTKKTEIETKSLQLINIFAHSENLNNSVKEHISKEDKEFLEKLSPPLKKKENMLSYFKKIEKDSEYSFESEDESKTIKVKLAPKLKKKEKRKKLTLQKEMCLDNNEKDNVSKTSSDVNVIMSKNKVKQKRKRDPIIAPDTKSAENDCRMNINEETNESRPKRNVKKPVKYSEELYQSSSDEDLHIFTPNKKRHIDDNRSSSNIAKVKKLPQNAKVILKPVNLKNNLKLDYSLTKKPKQGIHIAKKPGENINIKDKPVKLAPIFNTKQNSDIEAIEAKQKFLHSGIPDQLKQLASEQKRKSSLIPYFATVVHVQQKDTSFENLSTRYDYLSKFYSDDDINSTLYENKLFETLLNLSDCDCNMIEKSSIGKNVNDILQYLKRIKPRFPIYRTYHMLRGKRKGEFKGYNYNDLDNSREVINGMIDTCIESPDQLPWSDRYKATSTNQIIGNFESINELKKWLVSWNENHIKTDSNSDSDFYHSDSESENNSRKGDNLIILTGPVGSGKTSSVYAVAAELAIKVIEVNVSNKRTGKIMLQDLQEATQSHKVNRGASSSENSQKLQEIINVDELKILKKRGRSKKQPERTRKLEPIVKFESVSMSQEITRTDTSLILIDDADVVFEQDDGFSSAIVQLVQSSKRPVILVVSTLSCQHLQRFLQNGKILRMNPLSPKILGMWLDIMSLADTGLCFPGAGAKILNYYKGDIRKSINTLQFYMSTQSQTLLNDEEDSQAISTLNTADNENSSMSWVNGEDSKDDNLIIKNITPDSGSNSIWNYFVHKECNLLHLQYPLQLFNIWWSLDSLISRTNERDRQIDNKSKTIIELQSVANTIDDISLADYFNHSSKATRLDVTSDPWSTSEIDNITEVEDLSFYVKNYETNAEICHELVKNSIRVTQETMGVENKYYIDLPGMAMQSERDRIVSRHNNLSKYLNSSAVLDRKAVALDYWPFCRTLCQIEKEKTDGRTKRKNRFCHYLKSLNILCNNESFERLCYSLSFK